MIDKPVIFIIYAAFGVLFTITSIGLLLRSRSFMGNSTYQAESFKLVYSLVIIVLIICFGRYLGIVNIDFYAVGAIYLIAVISIQAKISQSSILPTSAGGLLAWIVCASLLYWMRAEDGHVIINGGKNLLVFVAPWGAIAYCLLSIKSINSPSSQQVWFLIPFFVLAGLLIFSLSVLDYFPHTYTFWHHWSAYIAPSEMVRAGMHLFIDIPAQYGAGMTALITTFCGSNCWNNAYLIFGLISLFYSIAIVLIGTTYKFRNIIINLVILLGLLNSTVLFTAYPPNLQSVLATPSVGGSRFLILAVLSCWIIFKPLPSKWQLYTTHAIWWIGVLWSPESAFCCTAVWFPLYMLDYIDRGSNARCGLANAGVALAHLGIITLLLTLITYSCYFLWTGDFPNLYFFWIYAIYPPAALPMNLGGAVWFAILVMLLSIIYNWFEFLKLRNYREFRKSLVLQLMAYSATSFFLGRSHDNNILNLTPFYYLLILDCLYRYRSSRFMLGFSATCISFLICVPSQFGWTQWSRLNAAKAIFDFDISKRLSSLNYVSDTTRTSLSRYAHASAVDFYADAASLINIVTERGERYFLHDSAAVLQVYSGGAVWSAGHLMSNYHYMPESVKIDIIQRGADRLKLSGWVIVSNEIEFLKVLTIFDSAYIRSESIQTETYTAVKFHPKTAEH
jgi:hypothetical protein